MNIKNTPKTNFQKLKQNYSNEKKHFYNLYKNPFIDLTDDEEETKKIKKIKKMQENEIKKENYRKMKNITFKVVQIYQENFFKLFSREFIFHKYKIFNQELNGFYSSDKMQKLFENLFKNYNNMFIKKIPKKNNSYNDIRDNRINTMPLINNRNIDTINTPSNNTIKKYSSLDNLLNSLKNQVIMQRKKLNNNLFITNVKNEIEKNKNKSYLKDYDSELDNNIIRNFSPINLKNNSKYNSLNVKEVKNEDKNSDNNLYLFKNLQIYNRLNKLINFDNNKKIKEKKINAKLMNIDKDKIKNKSKINYLLLNDNKKEESQNIFHNPNLRNRNNIIIRNNDKIRFKNNSFDFEIKRNQNINEILINKYSQNLLNKLKIIDKPGHNYPNDINNINTILLNKNHYKERK